MTRRGIQCLKILAVVALMIPIPACAQPAGRLDTWASMPEGLFLSGEWQPYPGSSTRALKFPPAIVIDSGRRVLQIKTENESVKIGRAVRIDVAQAPRLVWEWKAVTLPQGGDVRHPQRNDQVARVVLLFEGLKAILYLWDTTAPAGLEVRAETLGEPVDRALIVIRSGTVGLGQWHREVRDVAKDYTRLFGETPGTVKWVGLESHSDDVHSQGKVLFGLIQFDPR